MAAQESAEIWGGADARGGASARGDGALSLVILVPAVALLRLAWTPQQSCASTRSAGPRRWPTRRWRLRPTRSTRPRGASCTASSSTTTRGGGARSASTGSGLSDS